MPYSQGSAPAVMSAAGERELLIHSLRTAVTKSRLVTNTLETIGVALRHKQIDCDSALQWLRHENLLDHIQLGHATHAAYRYFEGRDK